VGEVQPDGTTTTVDSTTHVISAIQLTVIGNATLAAGTITVSTASACTVGSSCTYQLTNCGTGGTVGFLSVGTITAGTSFVISSSSATDTSKVCWSIIP
jgi:hypothetical protein